jgi:hypothetical protein
VALAAGSAVVVLGLKAYGPASLDVIDPEVPAMRAAAAEGRLLLCRNVEDIPEVATAAVAVGLRFGGPNRAQRIDGLARLLRG